MSKRKTMIDAASLTLEEGDRILGELAEVEVRLAGQQARYEARILTAKTGYELETAGLRVRRDELASRLEAVILANRAEFGKVRSRETSHGVYGLRRSTALKCAKGLLERLQEAKLAGLLRIGKTTLNKPAITQALKEGQTIEGAALVARDTAYHEIKTELLDAARGPERSEA